MKKMFCCLAFILTNAVMAQASEPGTVHFDGLKWVTTYSGETKFNDLPAHVHLDVSDLGLQVPDSMLDGNGGTIPSLLPVIRHHYRLTLIVSDSPRIAYSYMVEPRTISMDGTPKFAYVSDLEASKSVQFLVTNESNGNLRVSYNGKGTDGQALEGNFVLSPVAAQ